MVQAGQAIERFLDQRIVAGIARLELLALGAQIVLVGIADQDAVFGNAGLDFGAFDQFVRDRHTLARPARPRKKRLMQALALALMFGQG